MTESRKTVEIEVPMAALFRDSYQKVSSVMGLPRMLQLNTRRFLIAAIRNIFTHILKKASLQPYSRFLATFEHAVERFRARPHENEPLTV